MTQDSGSPHGGLSAAALTWTSTSHQDLRTTYRSAVTPYQRYICHLWVLDQDIAGDVRVFIHWFDGAGAHFGSDFPSAYSINQPSWQELQHGASAPQGAAFMSCGVRMYDTSGFWDGDATVIVDDLSISLP